MANGEDTRQPHRRTVKQIQHQLDTFSREIDARVVVINLASTEHALDMNDVIYQEPTAFETALDEDHAGISPAMLYAYACIKAGVPYGNFTPSTAADVPALVRMAAEENTPVAGKDGKTGQTYLKTVLAPALRARALQVDGWFSTNILGNRDGEALRKPGSLQNKINTKGDVLTSCLGYPVEDHVVKINYYKPRGDNKEAWDNIDINGFLGHEMQIKVNFLCKDSILAAPLAIEIARCLDLAVCRSGSGTDAGGAAGRADGDGGARAYGGAVGGIAPATRGHRGGVLRHSSHCSLRYIHRTRAAAVTDADILGDLDLVHPGPLREFQDNLLQNTGLWKLT